MSLIEWAPVVAGGTGVYWMTTRVAGTFLRARFAAETATTQRVIARDRGRSRFSFGRGNDEDAKPSRAGARGRPLPNAEQQGPSTIPQSFEAAAQGLATEGPNTLGPATLTGGADTLPMGLKAPKRKPKAATGDGTAAPGTIESLDFTLAQLRKGQAEPAVSTPAPETAASPVAAPTVPASAGAAEQAGSMVLEFTPSTPPEGAAPKAPPADPATADNSNNALDWNSAALSFRSAAEKAETDAEFFTAPVGSRDISMSQRIRLAALGLSPENPSAAPSTDATHAGVHAPGGAEDQPGSPAAAPPEDEMIAPGFELPGLSELLAGMSAKTTPTGAPIKSADAPEAMPAPAAERPAEPAADTDAAASKSATPESFDFDLPSLDGIGDNAGRPPALDFNQTGAAKKTLSRRQESDGRTSLAGTAPRADRRKRQYHTPTHWRRRVDPVYQQLIEHDAFRQLAVAHDDIQAARFGFEQLLELEDGPANPTYRLVLFGALIAYSRAFQQGDTSAIDARFSSERFGRAHEELLEAHARLLSPPARSEDEVLRVAGDEPGEEQGDEFVVHTALINDAQAPMYAALCNFIEVRLLELLQEASREAFKDGADDPAISNESAPMPDLEVVSGP